MKLKLCVGDLIFVRGSGFIARMIEDVTRSKYSHVAIYVGYGQVFEAQGMRTAGYRPLLDYNGSYDVVCTDRTPSEVFKGIAWLKQQKGREYSYWSIFVIAVKKLFGIDIPWHEGREIICSRLARDYVYQLGYPIPDVDMTPEEVYEWMMQNTLQPLWK